MKSALAVPDATLAVRHREPDGVVLEFAGHWLSQRGLPEPSSTLGELRAAGVSHLTFDARQITAWDSGLVTFVLKVLGEMQARGVARSEEHTSELQSRLHLVCRLLLEKKKKKENIDMRLTAH